MYITFEGPEATGKSTQVERLGEFLRERGIDVLVTKEPGTTHNPVCQDIRKVLLNPEHEVCDLTALMLFLADRRQHMEKVVMPALEAGKMVISDRSSLSTLVYHLATKDEHWDFSDTGIETLVAMLNLAQPVEPDVCFVARSSFDWSKSQLVQRMRDRIELKDNQFHDRIHMYFEALITEAYNEEAVFLEDQKFFPRNVVGLPPIPANSEDDVLKFVLVETERYVEKIGSPWLKKFKIERK